MESKKGMTFMISLFVIELLPCLHIFLIMVKRM